MSEADKLFEELGYEKESKEDFISYTQYESNSNLKKCIFFYISSGIINVKRFKILEDENILTYSSFLDMYELKAINLKCKELGMMKDE